MSAPIRFLGVAVLAYLGLRTASSALALEPMPAVIPLPPVTGGPAGGEAVAAIEPDPSAAMAPMPPMAEPQAYAEAPLAAPLQPGMAPPMMAPAGMAMPYPMMVPYPAMPAMMPMPAPVRTAMPRSSRRAPQPASWEAPDEGWAMPPPPPPPVLPEPASAAIESSVGLSGYGAGETPPLEQWPAIGTAGPFSVGGLQQTPSWGRVRSDGPIAAAGQSRWSLDLWALARQPRSGLLSYEDPDSGLNPGLASGGSLGGSQAGMRLTYRPLPRVGLHLRASTALLPQGRRGQALAGGEGSMGVSYQPVAGLPVRLLAERRQRFGPALGGGRNAFAFLAEGGLNDRHIARGIVLDGYGQAGMVGARSRSLFADGALTATAPVLPRFAFGGGMWGGMQPGLSRFDAGPRLSYQMSPLLRLHLDYRVRVTGRADPPSGPALTIGGGF